MVLLPSDDGGVDIFVHISAVQAADFTELQDNQKLSYELEEGRNGRAAAASLQLVG